MSYDFRKIYRVAEAAGCEISSSNTQAKNLERLNAVKLWIDSEFSDIFEAVVVETSTSACVLRVYFKGTVCGIYLTLNTSTSTGSNNNAGVIYNSTTTLQAVTGTTLYNDAVKMLVIKSKYGVIAGFFTANVGNNVRAMAVNMGNRFMPIIIHAATQVYIADGHLAAVQSNLMRCGTPDNTYLTKFFPPDGDAQCDHAFMNLGASTNDCVLFRVGDDDRQFAELQGIEGYNTFTLELEEPSPEDFEEIEPIWN